MSPITSVLVLYSHKKMVKTEVVHVREKVIAVKRL